MDNKNNSLQPGSTDSRETKMDSNNNSTSGQASNLSAIPTPNPSTPVAPSTTNPTSSSAAPTARKPSSSRSARPQSSSLQRNHVTVVNPKKRALQFLAQTGGSDAALSQQVAAQAESSRQRLARNITSNLNDRLDRDIDSLVSSFEDIIQCSKVQNKDKFQIQQEKYQLECRTANMISRCESILCLLTEMKQNLFLNDTTRFCPPPLLFTDPGAPVPTGSATPSGPDPKKVRGLSPGDAAQTPIEVVVETIASPQINQRQQFLDQLTNLQPNAREKLRSLSDLFPVEH